MLVLGLILILIAAGVLVAVLVNGSTGAQATMFDGHLHASALVFFLIGAAALLVFIMGLELVRSGLRRANRNRKNNKRLRRLERREAARRGDVPDREATVAAGPSAGTTDRAGAPEAAPAAAEPGGTEAATRRADGPYQNPPATR
jgi:nucleoid-associated protein YgaU